jgi:hypothetical protein
MSLEYTLIEILNTLLLYTIDMARKVGVTVTLRPDQVEWLENHDESMSEATRQAIDAHAELNNE